MGNLFSLSISRVYVYMYTSRSTDTKSEPLGTVGKERDEPFSTTDVSTYLGNFVFVKPIGCDVLLQGVTGEGTSDPHISSSMVA